MLFLRYLGLTNSKLLLSVPGAFLRVAHRTGLTNGSFPACADVIDGMKTMDLKELQARTP